MSYIVEVSMPLDDVKCSKRHLRFRGHEVAGEHLAKNIGDRSVPDKTRAGLSRQNILVVALFAPT